MGLSYEKIEDVQLGIEALLAEASQGSSRIDLEVAIGESDLEATVALSDHADGSDTAIGLARVLRALGAELRVEENSLCAQFDSLSDRVSDER